MEPTGLAKKDGKNLDSTKEIAGVKVMLFTRVSGQWNNNALRRPSKLMPIVLHMKMVNHFYHVKLFL